MAALARDAIKRKPDDASEVCRPHRAPVDGNRGPRRSLTL
jgi:hypothetical protein